MAGRFAFVKSKRAYMAQSKLYMEWDTSFPFEKTEIG